MQITDEMVRRAAIAHHFACLLDAGLPPEDIGVTAQEAWDTADDEDGKGEEEALRHMRIALEAALSETPDAQS